MIIDTTTGNEQERIEEQTVNDMTISYVSRSSTGGMLLDFCFASC